MTPSLQSFFCRLCISDQTSISFCHQIRSKTNNISDFNIREFPGVLKTFCRYSSSNSRRSSTFPSVVSDPSFSFELSDVLTPLIFLLVEFDGPSSISRVPSLAKVVFSSFLESFFFFFFFRFSLSFRGH